MAAGERKRIVVNWSFSFTFNGKERGGGEGGAGPL